MNLQNESGMAVSSCRFLHICVRQYIYYLRKILPLEMEIQEGTAVKKRSITELLIFIVSAELVGALSGILAGNMKSFYQSLEKPPLAPPGWLFPVMWSILYAVMGITAYCIYAADGDRKQTIRAYLWYGAQLGLNFLWSIVFFRFHAVDAALVVVLLLIIAVVGMIVSFRRIRPAAGWGNLPYLAWLLFAAYLNFGVWILN